MSVSATPSRSVGLVTLEKGKPNLKIVAALREATDVVALEAGPANLLPAPVVRKKVAERCRSNAVCLTSLAKKAGADLLFVCQITKGKRGIAVQYVAVEAASTEIVARGRFLIASPRDAEKAVRNNWGRLMAVPSAPSAANDLDLPLAPLDFASPSPPLAGADPSAGDELSLEALTPPSALTPPPPPSVAQAPETTLPGLQVASASLPALEQDKSHRMLYAGLISVGVGAAAWVAAGVFNNQAGNLKNSITYGPGGTTQLQALAIQSKANSRVARANVMIGVGSALTVLGAALIGVDLAF